MKQAERLFAGRSDAEIRGLCVRTLKSWHATATSRQFSVHGDLVRGVVTLLIEGGAAVTNAPRLISDIGEMFVVSGYDLPWMAPIVEFVDWLTRAGFAIALSPDRPTALPVTYRVTRAGVRLLEQVDDHPLLPGYVERLQQRCPGLRVEVVALLVDARTCLEHGLLRPAIVVLGVAYETAVEAVSETLVGAGVVQANILDRGAAQRIDALRAVIDSRLAATTPPERDHRAAVHAAYDFAHQLRRRRNDASHTTPRYGFEDREEIEEFLVSAERHFPALWSLRA